MTHRTTGSSDCQSTTIKLIAASIPKLGRFIHQLIECREYVIRELYFTNGLLAHASVAYAETDDSLFF
jgi:hypothetical protein